MSSQWYVYLSTLVPQLISVARIEFRVQCATTLLTFGLESELHLPQTLMVIITALAAEYCGKLSISPPDMLHGLAVRLSSCIRGWYVVCCPIHLKDH